jgi:hypothetical protein
MAGLKRPAEEPIGLDEVITKPKLQQLLRQVARHPKDALDEDAEEVCVCVRARACPLSACPSASAKTRVLPPKRQLTPARLCSAGGHRYRRDLPRPVMRSCEDAGRAPCNSCARSGRQRGDAAE